MKLLIDLFITFCKIGSLTFGGGYAMLPILQKEVVDKKKWASSKELMDYYAIGQCTPGVIAVNTATFIGYKEKKILGALFATLGVIFPSLVIITIITAFISNFSDLRIVQDAFAGIRVCVSVLIITTVIKLYKSSIIDTYTLFIFLLVILLSVFTKISPVILVIIATILGIILHPMSKEVKK